MATEFAATGTTAEGGISMLVHRAFCAQSSTVVSFSNDCGSWLLKGVYNRENAPKADGVVAMIQQLVAMQKSCLERDVNATVRVSLLELRGRKFSDLLSQDPQPKPVSIRDSDTNKHPSISGAEEMPVFSSSEVLDCLEMGLARLSGGESAADEAEHCHSCEVPDSTEEGQPTRFHRHPDSHLIFTISILLQGKRSSMPSTASVPGKPPPPPPAPKTSFAGVSTPRSIPTPRREVHTHTSTQPQEECLARATIRIVDLNMPPSTAADVVTPSSEQAARTSGGLGAGRVLPATPPQPIPVLSPSQRTTSASGSLDGNLSPATTPNQRALPSPGSPAAAQSGPRHMTLQTSSRRLGAQQPTRSKVSSIASGGEPRADVLQAAQIAGLVPSPQSAQAYSADGLSGFEALERALDKSVHGSPLVRYKMHPLTRILRSALLGTCHLRVIPPTVPDSGDTSGVYARAQGLIQRLRSIPQLRPVCDVGVLDLQSDVGKWIRYENHNLRTDLKGAHDKIALLQKYLHARGDHEMKTWDLWKELQGSESTAQELRDEICELKEALGSTRNAAAASAASLEIAKARAHAEAARSTTARREAASAAARADAMEVAVERMAQQLANVASGSTAHVVEEQPETRRTNASPRPTPSHSGGPHARSEQPSVCLSVTLHVVRGYVAVRVRCLNTDLDTSLPDNSCNQPSAHTPVAAPLTLQQLQSDLISALTNAEQRHHERCSHLPGAIDSSLSAGSFSAISTAKSLVTLLARVLPRSTHTRSGLWAQVPEQEPPVCHSLKLPQSDILSEGPKDTYTDRSSLSERAPMPHTPTTAPHVPTLPHINAHGVVTDSQQQRGAGNASPDRLKQSRSPIPSANHPAHPKNALDESHGCDDAAPRALHASPFENHGAGASVSCDSSVYSPRGAAASNIASQPSVCTLGTEDSAVLGSPKNDIDAGACTAWPANLGVSHSEWMAALALVPQLPQVLQIRLDELAHRQGDNSQEQEVLRRQVEQFSEVVAMLFQPFEDVPEHALWALYGWLEPWFRTVSKGGAEAGSPRPTETFSVKESSSVVDDRIPAGNGPADLFLSHPGIPPLNKEGGTGDLAVRPGYKAWRHFAAMLHGMVAAGFKGYSRIFNEQQEQHRNKLAMLDECIRAYQVCLYGHAEIHQHDAGKLAELERIREDAEARAQVFDDTVANLVRAKMAHATADVTLRAMRDQIEQLSAQVPLQNGYGTNAPSWRLANHAARLRAAAEPGVTAAVHKSAAVVSKTISGLSSYFGNRQVAGRSTGNRRNS